MFRRTKSHAHAHTAHNQDGAHDTKNETKKGFQMKMFIVDDSSLVMLEKMKHKTI